MPVTGQKVCGGCGGGSGVWWLKPTLVFRLAQAEQFSFISFIFKNMLIKAWKIIFLGLGIYLNGSKKKFRDISRVRKWPPLTKLLKVAELVHTRLCL